MNVPQELPYVPMCAQILLDPSPAAAEKGYELNSDQFTCSGKKKLEKK